MGCVCGRRFENDWELEAKLGQGAFGTVWRAKSKKKRPNGLPTVVAVKQMDKAKMSQMRVSPAMVTTEADLQRLCQGHPNIVDFYDAFTTGKAYMFVLELCDGGDLDSATMKEDGRALSDRQQACLIKQVLEGIRFMHSKSICHRDIKPQNCMLVGQITSPDAVVKITDFGISRIIEDGQLAKEQVGTPVFMAPEMHNLPNRSNGYGLKVDLWAAGGLAVFLMANAYAFVDSSGRLMRDQLLEGKVPLWDAGGFSGLFQSVGEAVGLARKRPTRAAQDLVRGLLNPDHDARLSADKALAVAWFQPGASAEEGDGGPLLLAGGFKGLFSGTVGGVLHSAMDAVARASVDLGSSYAPAGDATVDCGVCREKAGELAHRCANCQSVTCISCINKLPSRNCPQCQNAIGGDVAVTAAVVGGLQSISDALGFSQPADTSAGASHDASNKV